MARSKKNESAKQGQQNHPGQGGRQGGPGQGGDAGGGFSPADFEKVGPRSIQGVEVSDLPDKGRGAVDTDFGREAGRNVPQNTGETVDPDSVHQTGHG